MGTGSAKVGTKKRANGRNARALQTCKKPHEPEWSVLIRWQYTLYGKFKTSYIGIYGDISAHDTKTDIER